VVSAFRHVWPDSWGPRLDYILTNAVRALLDVPGATLLMLPRLLIDEPFRVSLIAHHVSDPVVRAFWQNEYAGYSDSFRGEAVAPIQNKIGKALMVPSLRNMLCCRVPRTLPAGFIEPCIPTAARVPPSGPGWLHEIKHDDHRLMARLEGRRTRFFSRRGHASARPWPV
jgi:ATP-dependent DNA ligase